MPRIARAVAVNYPHHVTQRGNNRGAVFFDEKDKAFYLKTLRLYSDKLNVQIRAYCLMPNHVHVLAVPLDTDSLSQCMGRTSMLYTQYVNRKYKRSGRLWQNRFFSTIIEAETYLWSVMRYIERNPVKAGMVTDPEGYKWSSCKANMRGKNDLLVRGGEWLDIGGRAAYRKFVMLHDSGMEQRIRRATSTGRPLGSVGFVINIESKLLRRLMPGRAGRPRRQG
ncbi:MAG TPA: transposase [Syntrophales bacterium]|nr:transposase [Syntrophales bacterium]